MKPKQAQLILLHVFIGNWISFCVCVDISVGHLVAHCPENQQMSSATDAFTVLKAQSGLKCGAYCLRMPRCLMYNSIYDISDKSYTCEMYDVISSTCVAAAVHTTSYRKKGVEQCPNGYTYEPSMEACYKVEQVDTPEPDIAYGLCSQHGASVHLLALETQEEQTFITNLVSSMGMDYYWTSAMSHHPTQDSSVLSSWYWTMSDGTKYPLTFMNWKGTEPNNKEGRGEIYAMLRAPEFEWIDIAYSYNSGWSICEYNIYY